MFISVAVIKPTPIAFVTNLRISQCQNEVEDWSLFTYNKL